MTRPTTRPNDASTSTSTVVPLRTPTRPELTDLPQSRRFTQGALALTYPRQAEPAPVLRLVAGDGGPATLERWTAGFLQAVIEVVSSDRSPTQLARWTSPQVYADLSDRHRRVAVDRASRTIRAARHQVASVHVCQVDDDVVEVSARVVTGRRSRAIAARFVLRNDRWVCTELVFG